MQEEIPDPNITEGARLPINIQPKADVLFVIDNSSSTLEEQASLKANFNTFISILDSLDPKPDLNIAVISTDVGMDDPVCPGDGDNGMFHMPSNCGVTDNYIRREVTNGNITTNFTGTLDAAFQCAASVGATGCGIEQPLEAMKRALAPSDAGVMAHNAGFLREDALLGVVFITDEDDCSASDRSSILAAADATVNLQCAKAAYECDTSATTDWTAVGTNIGCELKEQSNALFDIDGYIDSLRAVKEGHAESTLVVASIAGQVADDVGVRTNGAGNLEVAPSCSFTDMAGQLNEARPPLRMNKFISSFAKNTEQTLCTEDLGPAIQQIAELLAGGISDGCVPQGVDATECVAEFEAEDPTETFSIPQCSSPANAAGEAPCWYFDNAAQGCDASEAGFHFEVPAGFTTRGHAKVDCAIE